jgi:hypothetical protein
MLVLDNFGVKKPLWEFYGTSAQFVLSQNPPFGSANLNRFANDDTYHPRPTHTFVDVARAPKDRKRLLNVAFLLAVDCAGRQTAPRWACDLHNSQSKRKPPSMLSSFGGNIGTDSQQMS